MEAHGRRQGVHGRPDPVRPDPVGERSDLRREEKRRLFSFLSSEPAGIVLILINRKNYISGHETFLRHGDRVRDGDRIRDGDKVVVLGHVYGLRRVSRNEFANWAQSFP